MAVVLYVPGLAFSQGMPYLFLILLFHLHFQLLSNYKADSDLVYTLIATFSLYQR